MINRNNFLLKEIPEYHPLSSKYTEWWREQKKYCIEGYWCSGIWMPGNLYFYVNFGTIMLNKSITSKSKSLGRPLLRDIEWEFFYNWMETRGFSGFSDDKVFTCHRQLKKDVWDRLDDYEKKELRMFSPSAFDEKGNPKQYVNAREYMRKTHICSLGRPLFDNEAKDFMMMGSREFGKSYMVGVGIVLYEWLFDGAKEYTDESIKNPTTTVCAVGAGEAKYSTSLLEKVKVSLDNLPGSYKTGEKYFPSPFYKQNSGSFNVGSDVIATYRKKINGNWLTVGSGSAIKHRSYKDNPFAFNGVRCSVLVLEEIGMFTNLIASRNASVDCLMAGSRKYGSMMLLGTGGDMDSGTIDAHKMFKDPETYNLLAFDDIWEHTGKIGYFVPAYIGLNDCKDENGFTLYDVAMKKIEARRKTLLESKSGGDALDSEIINRPIIPSEAFLVKKGNLFPTYELSQRLRILDLDNNHKRLEKNVELFFDKNEPRGVNYKLDLENKLGPLNNFPLTDLQKKNREGCVTIYEFPVEDETGEIPQGMYIMGHDPYASDDPDGESLATIYVLKTKKHTKYGMDEIVASYAGRPYSGRWVYNEVLHKLSMFYGNAKIYFENVVGNTKEYFEKVKRLDLLSVQPQTVLNKKAGWASSGRSIIYGYPMNGPKMKAEGIQYMRDWLLEERGANQDGKAIRNLDLIPDRALLQEMIAFNMDGNFDRVMGFMGCIIGLEETHNQYVEQKEERKNELDFLTHNKWLFKTSTFI